MSQPTFGIGITADDRTAKGFTSAEKRAGKTSRKIAEDGKRWARETQSSIGRTSGGMLRTFGQVEQAGARLFGGRSITSGVTSRLGAVGEAAGAARAGMTEAAGAGGMLSTVMGGVGVAVAGTIGILAAAGYAAFKFADGWAKGAASIGHSAETIGLGTKALQEFTAAAERQGMDKGAATGTLGSLSQTLNDARYGRNNNAVAVLNRLGVKMQTNKDGTVNVAAMLPAIADAIARQNSSGRRTAAQNLGIGLDALPVFAQGGKALSADMIDADTHASVIDDAGIATGKRIARKSVMVGQLKDRALTDAGAAAAGATEGGYDAVLNGGKALLDGSKSFGSVVTSTFRPAAEKIAQGGRAIERAAVGLTSAVISAAQRVAARHGQFASVALAQYGVESGYGKHMPKGSNNPFGIKARGNQPYVVARTREEDRFGRSYYVNAKFRKFTSLDEAFEQHAKLLDGRRYARVRNARSADEAADALHDSGYATDHAYAPKLKREIHKRGLDRYDTPKSDPVHVTVELKNAPAGTRATVRRGGSAGPAISHAMQQ